MTGELFFQRLAQRELAAWATKDGVRPLLLRGPSGCGTSTLIADLAKKAAEGTAVVFDLKRDARALATLSSPSDAESMLEGLAKGRPSFNTTRAHLYFDNVPAAKARLVLDGVMLMHQRFNRAHMMASGEISDDIFDATLRAERFAYVDVGPLTFGEFLAAVGKEDLARPVLGIPATQLESVHEALLDELAVYLTVGGVPEVVKAYVAKRSIGDAAQAQREYVARFRRDLGSGQFEDCVTAMWNTLVAHHGERFDFTAMKSDFALPMRKRAVELLADRRIFRRVSETIPKSEGLTLGQQQRGLRAVLFDAGLLRFCREELKKKPSKGHALVSLEDRVALDQALAQELTFTQRGRLFSWTSTVRGSSSRVDFLADIDGKAYPIVLSGEEPQRQESSMSVCLDTYPDCPAGIFFSTSREVEWRSRRELHLPIYHALSATTRAGMSALLQSRPKKGS